MLYNGTHVQWWLPLNHCYITDQLLSGPQFSTYFIDGGGGEPICHTSDPLFDAFGLDYKTAQLLSSALAFSNITITHVAFQRQICTFAQMNIVNQESKTEKPRHQLDSFLFPENQCPHPNSSTPSMNNEYAVAVLSAEQ